MRSPPSLDVDPSPPRPPDGWVRGPLWDGLFMLSGLWLAPLVWSLGRGHERVEDSDANVLYLVLSAAFWIGHRVSSSYLAYCTSAYRPLLTTQRTRFIWVPLGIAAAVFLFLLPGEEVWPWPREQRVMLLLIADYALITYHFSSQHYGILALYRVRAGQRTPRCTKAVDRWFALGIGGLLVVGAEAVAGTVFFQDVWLDPLLGQLITSAHRGLQVAGTAIVVVVTLAMLGLDGAAKGLSLPRALYLLNVSFVVCTAFWVDPFVFLLLWTVQHWTAATGLATVVAGGDPAPARSRWYRLWHRVSRRPALLLGFLIGVSALLFPLMEVEASTGGGSELDDIVPWLMGALSSPGVVSFLVALGFVTGFVHYQLDRAVFRFSHPEVRRAAAAALLNPPS